MQPSIRHSGYDCSLIVARLNNEDIGQDLRWQEHYLELCTQAVRFMQTHSVTKLKKSLDVNDDTLLFTSFSSLEIIDLASNQNSIISHHSDYDIWAQRIHCDPPIPDDIQITRELGPNRENHMFSLSSSTSMLMQNQYISKLISISDNFVASRTINSSVSHDKMKQISILSSRTPVANKFNACTDSMFSLSFSIHKFVDINDEDIENHDNKNFKSWLIDRKKKWMIQRAILRSQKTVQKTRKKLFPQNSSDICMNFEGYPLRTDPMLPQKYLTESSREENISTRSPNQFFDLLSNLQSTSLSLTCRKLSENVPCLSLNCKEDRDLKSLENNSLENSLAALFLPNTIFVDPPLIFHLNFGDADLDRWSIHKFPTNYNGKWEVKTSVPPKIFCDYPIPKSRQDAIEPQDCEDVRYHGKSSLDFLTSIYVIPSNIVSSIRRRKRSKSVSQSLNCTGIKSLAKDANIFGCLKILKNCYIPHDKSIRHDDLLNYVYKKKDDIDFTLSKEVVLAVRGVIKSVFEKRLENIIACNVIELDTNYPISKWFIRRIDKSFQESFSPLTGDLTREKAMEVLHSARSSGIIRNIYQNSRLQLFTGVKMRREYQGKCIYRGIFSGDMISTDVYERRYLSMIKRETVERAESLEDGQACIPTSVIACTLPSKLQKEIYLASSITMMLFASRIFHLNKERNLHEENSSALSKIKAKIPTSPNVNLMKPVRSQNCKVSAGQSKRKRRRSDRIEKNHVHSFEYEIAKYCATNPITSFTKVANNVTSHSDESNPNPTTSFTKVTNNFRSYSDGSNPLLSLKNTSNLSVKLSEELLHLMKKSSKIRKEAESFEREMSIIGSGQNLEEQSNNLLNSRSSKNIFEKIGDAAIIASSISKSTNEKSSLVNETKASTRSVRNKREKMDKKRKRKKDKKKKSKRKKTKRGDPKEGKSQDVELNYDETSKHHSSIVSPISPNNSIFTGKVSPKRETTVPTIMKNQLLPKTEGSSNLFQKFFSLNSTKAESSTTKNSVGREEFTTSKNEKSTTKHISDFSSNLIDPQPGLGKLNECHSADDLDAMVCHERLTKASIEYSRHLLVSENFVENYIDVSAELCTGKWFGSEDEIDSLKKRNFILCDCPLLDNAGVDIEIGYDALAITNVSSWYACPENSVRSFAKKVVQIAATNRYEKLMIFLSLDIPLTPTVASDIALLQNALIIESDEPCTSIGIQLSCQSSIGKLLGNTLVNFIIENFNSNREENHLRDLSWLETYAMDINFQDRAQFLLGISPSMTVLGALECLKCYSILVLASFDEEDSDVNVAGRALSCFIQHISKSSNRLNIKEVVRRQGIVHASTQSLQQILQAVTLSFS